MEAFITALAVEHLILPVVSFVIAALIGWIAKRFRDWTGVEIEARHRDAFQTSLENAARLAIMRHGPIAPGQQIPAALINESLNYVKTGAPDAVRHFGVRDETIIERLIPHFITGVIGQVFK